MNWLRNLFRPHPLICHQIVYIDTDIINREDIEKIKQRMTPVFVEFSGREVAMCQIDIKKAVMVHPK